MSELSYRRVQVTAQSRRIIGCAQAQSDRSLLRWQRLLNEEPQLAPKPKGLPQECEWKRGGRGERARMINRKTASRDEARMLNPARRFKHRLAKLLPGTGARSGVSRGLCPCDPRIYRLIASPVKGGHGGTSMARPPQGRPRSWRSGRIPALPYPRPGLEQFTSKWRFVKSARPCRSPQAQNGGH